MSLNLAFWNSATRQYSLVLPFSSRDKPKADMAQFCNAGFLPAEHQGTQLRAGKDAVLTAVRMCGYQPADDNEADAIAILLWAIETRGGTR